MSEVAIPPQRSWRRSLLLALLLPLLLLGTVWLYARLQSPYAFFGTVYPDAPQAFVFSGTDQNGQPWTWQPTGQTTALFFGFTHCPNICPLSLSQLQKLKQQLSSEQQKRFQVIMVSVDPQRDTPARLKAYVEYFGAATGVNIPEPELSQVAQAYGVGYQYVPVKTPEKYQVNHTTASYLIDSAGRLRLLWDYSQLPQTERLLKDLQYVMEHPAE